MALDRQSRWYRYHRLCHQMLRRELARREPGAARDVRLKAAAWCEANGLPESALSYADASGDEDYAAALLSNLVMPLYSSGQVATVERWLRRFDGDVMRQDPAISVLGAYIHAVRGRPLEAERWAAPRTGRHQRGRCRMAGRRSNRGSLCYARSCARTASPACERMPRPRSTGSRRTASWRGHALLLLGVAHALAGDEGDAEIVFADAGEIALRAGVTARPRSPSPSDRCSRSRS